MIIISKKRILNLLTLVTVCLTIFFCQSAMNTEKTVSTVTLPVTNRVIVIDAGHGIPDERS